MESNAQQRWWHANSELDRVVEAVRQKLERGALSEMDASLDGLATILEAHFSTEEDLYFPLIERAAPDSAGRVAAARAGHEKLRQALENLHALVESGDSSAARRALATLLQGLRVHESEEVKLILELERLSRS